MGQGFCNSIQVTPSARVISSIADNTNPVTITNGVVSDFLSIAVPSGRWMINGNFSVAGGGANYYNVWISTTSATFPSPDYSFVSDAGYKIDTLAPMRILTFTSTTTVYLSVWIDTATAIQGQLYAVELL